MRRIKNANDDPSRDVAKSACAIIHLAGKTQGVRGSNFMDWTSIHIRSMILRIINF